jgi:dTDP-4-dehydrorhamnose 3,5-epimerase
MIFTGTSLRGAFLVDPQPHLDERGSFARTWCQREFEAHGLEPVVVQCSSVVSAQAGTLRGMHYQCAPHEEAKLVRCVRGSIFEVILDLRLGSPTFAKHYAVVLSAANRRMLYVPKGFAQGYQTLEPDTEVLYQMSDFHAPAYARGVRWNDPAFAICWPPATRRIISARDQQYPDFDRRVQVEQSYRIASRG